MPIEKRKRERLIHSFYDRTAGCHLIYIYRRNKAGDKRKVKDLIGKIEVYPVPNTIAQIKVIEGNIIGSKSSS